MVVGYYDNSILQKLQTQNTSTLGKFKTENQQISNDVPIDTQVWDRYAYVQNNPITNTDPTGHCADPASGTLCLALIPAGPVGWVAIGVLIVVDIVLITMAVDHVASLDDATATGVSETTTLDLVVTAKKDDLQQVNDVGKKFGMTEQQRKAFGKFLEDAKANGEGGTANDRGDFTWKELEEKAREFLEEAENN